MYGRFLWKILRNLIAFVCFSTVFLSLFILSGDTDTSSLRDGTAQEDIEKKAYIAVMERARKRTG